MGYNVVPQIGTKTSEEMEKFIIMKLGIMQPYFFPYLGYWQLMNAVDCYVVYDDVNFIKRGRINRNAILMNHEAYTINLILSGASQNKHINQVQVNTDSRLQEKLLRTLEMCYSKAPYYAQVVPLLQTIIRQQESNLAQYLYRSFQTIGQYLGIKTELLMSSSLKKDCALKAEKKIIAICKLLGANEYYNSVNGIPLYAPHRDEFAQAGIELRFPKMREISYPQFKNEFIPNLSIIDVMMFNPQEECQRLLQEFDFV